MELKNFSYALPAELIAQEPSAQRDSSRMMILDLNAREIKDSHFRQLSDYLRKDDVLVINDSSVIPARLTGRKSTGAFLEILLLTEKEPSSLSPLWEALLKPAKRLKKGNIIYLNDKCEAEVLERISEKKWLLKFNCEGNFNDYLKNNGQAPLPPYIKRKKNDSRFVRDNERYQTVYARSPGSIAAPTAGLHFSPSVIHSLEEKGVKLATLTLHVGYGTFVPIETNEVEKHVMEFERYEISVESADIINNARRVIAVGTTSTRALESATDKNGLVLPGAGKTDLFIYPGYKFKKINGLLTNFHLPQSSLFLLVCAFAGADFIKTAYRQAIDKRYLFYSYGDCMLIL